MLLVNRKGEPYLYEGLGDVNRVFTRICFLKEYINDVSSLSDPAILFVYWGTHSSSEAGNRGF